MSNCSNPNCTRCNGTEKSNYRKSSDWEYLSGQWDTFWEFFRWGELIAFCVIMFFFCGIPISMLGNGGFLIGCPLGLLFFYGMSTMEGGAVADVQGYFGDPEEFPENTCSAGFEDCEICKRTYIHDHDFNVRYEAKRKWWHY